MPAAVSGQSGHDATFAAATALVRFGLDKADAWTLLLEYNARCYPPWSESDLRHKLDDAFRLARPDLRFTEAPHRQPMTTEETPEAKRARWPVFNIPTRLELHRIGELRNISIDGLQLAVDRGILRCADYYTQRAWIVTDGTGKNAQARRLDGQPWTKSDGTPYKAATLPGSIGSWPIGLDGIAGYLNILLLEGGPDLLAAHHFIAIEDQQHNCAAVALLGASNRIAESLLPRFEGKHIRLVPHLDDKGKQAAVRWIQALQPVAGTVDVLRLEDLHRIDGHPVEDLNDTCSIHPDEFEANRQLWNVCPL